ncbi:zinc fingers and homeoboxes protein 2-like [Gouania willdenowi]|uniref:Zinc fingers and homeoboxes protein 2-like n=1 Tax=Gouania willdenowi TaxID=441366 RepID=A0A8C5GJF9_GOUWI|nr:zinc fingers and homeoboxes protein 2-like [Gouania willdenowi]XP_028297590.1 zinc fingers and homeoboxes protein 2-like [Gouania willdenowi]XP_028297592.1 zinc fingers and homeoboxes protein 2-like [Gouania willdenowi]
MSSRRKSSTPCMVRVGAENKESRQEVTEVSPESAEKTDQENQNPESSELEKESAPEEAPPLFQGGHAHNKTDESRTESGGYECKNCSFLTHNLELFKDHMDSLHPKVILNPQYCCAICRFHADRFDALTEHNERHHPGEANFSFKKIKNNNRTTLEQTIKDQTTDEDKSLQSDGATPPFVSAAVKTPASLQSLFGGADLKSQLDGLVQKHQMAAVSINGTVILPDHAALAASPHVSPSLQRPPNFSAVPKVAVPLHANKYDPSLDHNLTLISSFNKFPYPTYAELSWLTAASKHPEDQIRVWFTTQRLKQGITWSPEEVEEARKKMFNGSLPPLHHTFATPSLATPLQQPLVQHPGQSQTRTKRSLPTHLASAFGPEAKRPVMAVAPHSGDPEDKVLMAPPPPPPPQKERLPMAPPPAPSDMKRPPTVPLMRPPLSPPSSSSKGKMVSMLGNPKTKPVVSLPSFVFPESLTRPTIVPAPFFAPPFNNITRLPSLPSLVTSQTRRPAVIQSVTTPSKPLSLVLGFPRGDAPLSPVTETNGTSHVDGKPSVDSSSSEGVEPPAVLTHFPLLERMKGKTPNQLKVLEESFLRNSFPSYADLDILSSSAHLSHQEVESWFTERRALRDNLEQALINSMGTKKTGDQHQQPNGINNPSRGPAHLHSLHPLPPLSPLSVPVDSRALALLEDDSAETRWPSPEELGHTGLLSRWFTPRRWPDGALSHGRKLLELELGLLMEQQQGALQECFTGRLRPEMKNGVAREVFWLDDGHSRKGRELLLERERKMMEESSGRLTG